MIRKDSTAYRTWLNRIEEDRARNGMEDRAGQDRRRQGRAGRDRTG